jgi:hypothetical protein
MDNRRMKVIPSPKPLKPWKEALSKEGNTVRLPSLIRIVPSKYSPKASKGPRNKPHCLSTGAKSEAIIKCRSCMWQTVCK